MVYLISLIIAFVLMVMVIRALGAWLLRIDEVITELKAIRKALKNEA